MVGKCETVKAVRGALAAETDGMDSSGILPTEIHHVYSSANIVDRLLQL